MNKETDKPCPLIEGDRVRVINYGHKMWFKKKEWQSMYEAKYTLDEKPKNLIDETDITYIYDISPECVGLIGIIKKIAPTGDYSIDFKEKGVKSAWYKPDQLELYTD